MNKIVIIDPFKCTRCGFHYTLGDNIVLAHGCAMPVTVSFECSNRRIVNVSNLQTGRKWQRKEYGGGE